MALSLAFGVLVDLDHFIDYWYAEGRICFNLRTFLRTRYWERSGRLFVLFHAFEYLPIVFLVWQAWKGRRWAVAATAAMSSHLLADHLVNELKPLGYFLLYRVAHGFRADEILDWNRVHQLEERRRKAKQGPRAGRLSWPRRVMRLFV
ncbi:MAG TPA: hypothetical protein VK009_03895 [Chloroflexota bacterium]|nr:hypothetical protein [Chloroflexota bacterium]